MKGKVRAGGGLVCPTVPDHGPLLEMADGRLLCPHAAHDGYPATHPLGRAEPTQKFFTQTEAEARKAVPA